MLQVGSKRGCGDMASRSLSVFELGLPSGFDVAGVPYVGFGSGVEQSYFDHSFQYILSAEFFLVRNRNSFCLFESEESAFTC